MIRLDELGNLIRPENRLYGFKMDFVGVYEDGNSILESRSGIWKIDRLENRLCDFKKNFSGCTGLWKSEIGLDENGEKLIGWRIGCTDLNCTLAGNTTFKRALAKHV